MLIKISPTDTKMHPEGPKMISKLPMGLPKCSWGHPMEPRGGQRRPQRKPNEILGVGPRAPRRAPREVRMPPESAKVVPPEALGEPHALQDGPREPKEGFRRRINEEK